MRYAWGCTNSHSMQNMRRRWDGRRVGLHFFGFAIGSGNWHNQHASPSCPRKAKGNRSRRGTCLHGEMADKRDGSFATSLWGLDPNFGFAGQLKHTKHGADATLRPHLVTRRKMAYLTSTLVFAMLSAVRDACAWQQRPRYQAAVRSLSRCCRMWIANTSLFPPHLSARRRGRDCSS